MIFIWNHLISANYSKEKVPDIVLQCEKEVQQNLW